MLIRQILPSMLLFLLVVLGSSVQPARAQMNQVVIELPIYGRILNQDFITQAERLAASEINRQFHQDFNRSMLEVVILGVRNGEMIPILRTTVSRNQWLQNPQVGVWTRYHSLSYALLHRDTDGSSGAASISTPSSSLYPYENVVSPDPVSQVQQAFREGRLTREELDRLVDELD